MQEQVRAQQFDPILEGCECCSCRLYSEVHRGFLAASVMAALIICPVTKPGLAGNCALCATPTARKPPATPHCAWLCWLCESDGLVFVVLPGIGRRVVRRPGSPHSAEVVAVHHQHS